MTDILDDTSQPALAHAAKDNLYRFFETLRGWQSAEYFESPALLRWWTPMPHPWFNGAFSQQPPAGDAREQIAATIAYFQEKNRSVFTWWLAPELEGSEWSSLLVQGGLGRTDDPPGMAVDLSMLNENLPLPNGLEIRRVEGAQQMKTWSEVFTVGYGLPPDWEPINREMMASIVMGYPCTCYTAYLDGEPAAVSALFYGSGVAGIYCVATLAEWRGRGLGAAVSLAPLLEARRAGYRVGILQSSEMGYKVYQRLGFREVCRVSHYYWQQQ